MKVVSIRVLLIALVFLNLLDGDFQHPSPLDFIKFILLAGCLILSFGKKGADTHE